jgi:hypothetical protein
MPVSSGNRRRGRDVADSAAPAGKTVLDIRGHTM